VYNYSVLSLLFFGLEVIKIEWISVLVVDVVWDLLYWKGLNWNSMVLMYTPNPRLNLRRGQDLDMMFFYLLTVIGNSILERFEQDNQEFL
jgi:hypothetical protein